MIKLFRKIRQNLLMENKTGKHARTAQAGRYIKYAIGEIVLVVIGIVIALQLNTWKEAKNNKASEQKILTEIRNGIWRDLSDFEGNIRSNKRDISTGKSVKDYINLRTFSQDSLAQNFNNLFNISIPVINKSGYESLKSGDLKTITNDSLRFQIVQLYDYYYTIIELGAYRQKELQAFSNYYPLIKKLYPFMEFNAEGDIISTSTPLLSDLERKELLLFIDGVIHLRRNILLRYDLVISNMKQLSVNIDKELDRYVPPVQLQQYTGTFERETTESEEDSVGIREITILVEDNYLTGFPSSSKNKKAFYMIGPDRFEAITLASNSGKRILQEFVRDTQQKIIGFKIITDVGVRTYKKIE